MFKLYKNITLLLIILHTLNLFFKLLKQGHLYIFHTVLIVFMGMKWELKWVKTWYFHAIKQHKTLILLNKLVRPAGLEPKTFSIVF